MKRIISIICILAMVLTLFSSCAKNSNPEITENTNYPDSYETEYLDVEKLYYYQDLYELLQNNQAEENLGRFNKLYEYNIPLSSEISEPQYVIHTNGKCTTYSDQSLGFPFAVLSCKMNANPFSNFNLLKNKGWVVPYEPEIYYENDEEKTEGVIFDLTAGLVNGFYAEYNAPMFSVKKTYDYSEQGCKDLLRTVSALEKSNVNSHKFISLEEIYPLEINYSEKDKCYYSYFIEYNRSNAYITALYFRSSDGDFIDDIKAQLMCISFPYDDGSAGISISFSFSDASVALGKMAFFMALEQSLAGTCLFSEDTVGNGDDYNKKYIMPYEYETENYSAKISEEFYETNLDYIDGISNLSDTFSVYTYSLKLK